MVDRKQQGVVGNSCGCKLMWSWALGLCGSYTWEGDVGPQLAYKFQMESSWDNLFFHISTHLMTTVEIIFEGSSMQRGRWEGLPRERRRLVCNRRMLKCKKLCLCFNFAYNSTSKIQTQYLPCVRIYRKWKLEHFNLKTPGICWMNLIWDIEDMKLPFYFFFF